MDHRQPSPGGSSIAVRGPSASWVLWSKGPDLHWAHTFNPPGVQELDYPQLYEYDPTKGAISIGNILRAGP